MKLLWLDLETTGLDPHTEEILEIAAVEADLLSPFEWKPLYHAVLGIQRPVQDLSPFILDMHSKNGLLKECLESTQWLGDADTELAKLVPFVEDKEERTVLAGSSIHFDMSFLRIHMPKLAGNLSHRLYDISAMKLAARSLGRPWVKPVPAHRAMDDVLASIADTQSLFQWLKTECGRNPFRDHTS